MSRPSEPSMSLGWMDCTNVTVFVIRTGRAMTSIRVFIAHRLVDLIRIVTGICAPCARRLLLVAKWIVLETEPHVALLRSWRR
jgi:hypothetical protein